jgi:hypothetical protein
VAHVILAAHAVPEKEGHALKAEKENNLAAEASAGRVYVAVNLGHKDNLVEKLAVDAEILGELLIAVSVPVLDVDVAAFLSLVKNNQRPGRGLGYLFKEMQAALVLAAVRVSLGQMLKAVVVEKGIDIVGSEIRLALRHEIVGNLDRVYAGDVVIDMAALRQGAEDMALENDEALAAALVAQNESDH